MQHEIAKTEWVGSYTRYVCTCGYVTPAFYPESSLIEFYARHCRHPRPLRPEELQQLPPDLKACMDDLNKAISDLRTKLESMKNE